MNTAEEVAGRLDTVARLYDLHLERSRSELAQASGNVAREKALQERIERQLGEVRALARNQMGSSTGVSADALRVSGAYEQWQVRQHTAQKERVLEAEQAAEKARDEVTRRLQALSAIENLAARRAREAAFERARLEQRALDELALERLAHARDTRHQESTHGG